MSTPVFTVIISTYNRRDLISRSVKSVLAQTFLDFELIVINNGSTDDTEFIVKAFKDDRIKYINNPEPTNSCDGPRNLGIEMARGEFISFLDDDDIWYPKKLEMAKKAFFKNSDVSAVCNYVNRRVDGRLDSVMKFGPWNENFYETILYEKNCLSPSATSIKTSLLRELKGFDLSEEFSSVADIDFWLRMAKKGVKVYYVEEVLGEFCLTDNNKSVVDVLYYPRVTAVFEKHILDYENKSKDNISRRGIKRLFNLYSLCAITFLKKGNYAGSLKYSFFLLRFILLDPGLLFHLCTKVRGRYS